MLDEIERVIVEAAGVSMLDGCLCQLGLQQHMLAARVRRALVDMGCDPVAVAARARALDAQVSTRMATFVITDQGFGAMHGSLRSIAMAAEDVFQAQAGA